MRQGPMSSEEFEKMLGKDVPTRITLSEPRRYSNDSLDEQVLSSKDAFLEMVSSSPTRQTDEFDSDFEDEPKKRQLETQSLAEFLRNTGPDNQGILPPSPKKKGGMFRFGKKKKQPETPTPIITGSKPKHVPIALTAGYLPDVPAPRHESKNQNIINNQLNLRQQQFASDASEAHVFKQANNLPFTFSNDFAPPKRQNSQDSKSSGNSSPMHQLSASELKMRQAESPLKQSSHSYDKVETTENGRVFPLSEAPLYAEPQSDQDIIVPVRNMSINNNADYDNYQREQDIYSDDEEDVEEIIEDQGLDEAIERNTEFNAIISNFEVDSTSIPQKSIKKERKSVFFAISNETVQDDASAPEDEPGDQMFKSSKVSGRGARGSFYPRDDDPTKMAFQARMSSLGALDQPKTNPKSSHRVSSIGKPEAQQPRKKKIRHVQIQTRGAMMKDAVAQTANLPESGDHKAKDEMIQSLLSKNESLERLTEQLSGQLEEITASHSQLELENSQVKEEIEDNRIKFDKLSAQAYKKIKELLMERKMLDLEVSTLRNQVCGFVLIF